MGGVAKEYITKLGCEFFFCRITYWATLEMLLPKHLKDYKSRSTTQPKVGVPITFVAVVVVWVLFKIVYQSLLSYWWAFSPESTKFCGCCRTFKFQWWQCSWNSKGHINPPQCVGNSSNNWKYSKHQRGDKLELRVFFHEVVITVTQTVRWLK